ncbi:hypothetical protein [Phenylobacterium sp. SCN 70-31]|uniref:hypothetical protein n=1 Tax=Phenylobacterium sp. SCN 70-31 TaxID=1660129 RepID=UPI0008698F22|nr:hypothetical protein [Phenylobacterium sp. SCN 70-31]ODT89141.1 MAG: hypothetical protein ABS78_02805 [Phenylobacterium sp. SCN 70-31]
MARRKPSPPAAPDTPVLEWIAAAIGALLTLGVLGYSAWEGVSDPRAPPDLSASAEAATPGRSGFVTPIVVRNASFATAANVEVIARLNVGGRPSETRRARFAYVPGRGEARGGVIFRSDPAAGRISVEIEGFAAP